MTALQQRDFGKVVTLVLVFTLNPKDGFVIRASIKWAADFQPGPCLQMLELDLLVALEFHALDNGFLVNCVNENQPLWGVVEPFFHAEEPTCRHH